MAEIMRYNRSSAVSPTGISFTKHISETHIVLIVSALTVSVNIMFENLAIIDRLAEVFCPVLPARYSCNRCDGVATQPLGQLPGAGNNRSITGAIGVKFLYTL